MAAAAGEAPGQLGTPGPFGAPTNKGETPRSLPQPPNMWDMERAYEPRPDPLTDPADPRIIYRDLPTTVALEWTPELVTSALTRHVRGFFDGSALLLDATMADPRVQATLHARTAGLLGRPMRYTAAQHRDQAKADEVMRLWRDEFPLIAPRATLGQFLYWGVGLGLAFAELRWSTDSALWRPELKVWHPQFAWFNIVTRRYIVSSMDGPMEVDGGNGRWVLYTPHGNYRGWMQAAVRAISIPWLIWQFAQRDAARFSEVHGIPILKAVVPIGGDAQLKRRFIEAASNLGQESVVMTPQGIDGYQYDLELLEATDRSFDAFFKLMDRCEQSITIAILGQNLTTQVDAGGSFAAAKVHGDVKRSIAEHDEATLSALVYEQIARPWALYNFGDADLAPRTHWDVAPLADENARIAVLRDFALACQALSTAGVRFDPNALAREFDLHIPSQEVGASLAAPSDALPLAQPSPKKASAPTDADDDAQPAGGDAPDGAPEAIARGFSTRALAKYDHIDFEPPKSVREEARRGLEWREEYGRGGTAVGVARARDLANGRSISPETARRMASYFARHEVDAEGEGWSPDEDGFPSAGRIAWALWGGDPGKAWASKLVRQIDAADAADEDE